MPPFRNTHLKIPKNYCKCPLLGNVFVVKIIQLRRYPQKLYEVLKHLNKRMDALSHSCNDMMIHFVTLFQHDTMLLAISTQSFTCEKPNCKGSCEQTFGCKQVFGKIQYDNNNHSELLQIYASYEDIQRHEGEVWQSLCFRRICNVFHNIT